MTDQPLPLTQALGLTRQPFDKNIPSKQLFLLRQIKQLFALLQQLLQRRGIALITGETCPELVEGSALANPLPSGRLSNN